MHPSKFIPGAATLAMFAVPLALEVPAHAYCNVTHQAGFGVSASIALGKKAGHRVKRRAGGKAHLFYEHGVGCESTRLWPIVPGVEIGLRRVPGVETRGEILARVGGGAIYQSWDPLGHLNALSGRLVGGLSFGKQSRAVVLGFDVRFLLLHLRISDNLEVGSDSDWRNRAFLDVGGELGLVPVQYISED